VNFTWSFSGDIYIADWGLKLPGLHHIDNNKRLVSLTKAGSAVLVVPSEYTGRVSGIRSGNSSAGRAIFTLSKIRKYDEKYYGCQLYPTIPDDPAIFDSVRLVVQGRCVQGRCVGPNIYSHNNKNGKLMR